MPSCAHASRYNCIHNVEKKSFSENVSKSDVEEQERHFSSFLSVKTEKKILGKWKIVVWDSINEKKLKASIKCLSQWEVRPNLDLKWKNIFKS